jgi:hypothetical protein
VNLSLRNLLRTLTADKRKLALMALLAGLGLLLWGRLLFRDVPRTALAAPKDPEVKTLAAAARAPGRPVVRVELPRTLDRDLFALDARYYPSKAAPDVPAVVVVPDNKSGPQMTDVQQQALSASRSLALQTTILGDRPRAVINGQVLAPGERINGFTLKKVMPRGVILEWNGIEVRLEM